MFGFIRGAVRNSPWVVIAVTAHVVALAVLSVIYVKSHDRAEEKVPGVVALAAKNDSDPDLEQPIEPPAIPRDSIPAPPTSEKQGPTNPDDVVVQDADPGRRGEVTLNTDPDKAPGELNPDPEADPHLKSGASGGTSMGMHGPGHAGLGASPWVGLRAGGGGPGGGGLGQGGKGGSGGHGATEKTQVAVLAALRWLKNHQSPDGRWSCSGFDALCKGNRCDGPGDSTNDVGVTGLALLAYLGAGHTHGSGPFRDTVHRGIDYLRSVQDAEGCIGSRAAPHFLYGHACGALALIEDYGMTKTRGLKAPAQNAVGFVMKARNPYMAWRYAFPADGENDTSVTGWMVMALKSAKLSDLDIEDGAVRDAISWVDKMTEPEFGRTGYQQRGGQPARTNDACAKFPANKSESLTAVGLTVRIFGGHTPEKDEMINKGADLLSKCLPKWDVDAGTIDFYYWYYGSLAMFQVGGPRWQKWNDAIKTALLSHQRLETDRCEYGSWDPVDPWGQDGGRVYSTALNCLTMEVYYRYPHAFGTDVTGEKK